MDASSTLGKRWRALSNSPTWLRDASTVTSPWRLGTWFIILNLLIVASLIGVYVGLIGRMQPHQVYSPQATLIAEMGLGRLFAGAIFLGLTFFLTLFAPLRVAGVFLAPRMGRYFDQIVLSGITPWRFLVGKIIGQQAFFAIVVAVSLPYFLLCLSFGAISPWEALLCLVMLFVYVHVLVIVYLATSVILSEFLALPLVIGGFLVAAVFGLDRISPNPIGGMTPVATILGMLYQDTTSHLTHTFRGGFGDLSLVTSHTLLFFILSAFSIGLGSLAVALGPINILANGLNTFGSVVLPGDTKRSGWLKQRFELRRRSELSFLYENNSSAWRQRDFQRRWCLREIIFALLTAAALIWTYWFFPPFGGGKTYSTLLLFCAGALYMNAFLFADPWMSERLYSKRWEAGNLNTLCFIANTALIWLGFGWLPSLLELDLAPNSARSRPAFLEIQQANLILITQFVLVGIALYAVLRWYIIRRIAVETSAILAFLTIAAVSFIPIWLGMLVNINTPIDDPDRLPWLSLGNPIQLMLKLDSPGSITDAEFFTGLRWSTAIYLIVALSFAALVWKQRQTLPRRKL